MSLQLISAPLTIGVLAAVTDHNDERRQNVKTEPKKMSFIDRLEQVSGAKSIAELARWTDLHYNTISNYKKDGRLPEANILLKLHEERGLNIHWLLTGEGNPYSVTPTVQNPITLSEEEVIEDQQQQQHTFDTIFPNQVALNYGEETLLIEVPQVTLRVIRKSKTAPPPRNAVNIPLIKADSDSTDDDVGG